MADPVPQPLAANAQPSPAPAAPLAAAAQAVQAAVAAAVAPVVRVPNPAQDNAFALAVANNRHEDAKNAILAGADPNLRMYAGGPTYLMHYVQHVNRPMVEFLLAHGADVNARITLPQSSQGGWTALNYSFDDDIKRILRAAGGRTRAELDDGTADSDQDLRLMDGIQNEDIAEVTAALDAGANVNHVDDDDGYTPLTAAIQDPDDNLTLLAIIRLLVSRGANVNMANTFGDAPLHCAAQHNNVAVIDILLEAGADVRARNEEGHTPREVARQESRAEAETRLASAEAANPAPLAAAAQAVQAAVGAVVAPAAAPAAAPARVANPEQDHALHLAIDNESGEDDESARAAILAGADPNLMLYGDRETVLIHYAGTDNLEMVRFLLAHGADVNGRAGPGADEPGFTALDYASDDDIRGILRDAGGLTSRMLDAPAEAPTTPELFTAIRLGRTGDVADLIRRGANVNVREEDDDLFTPLMAASVSDNTLYIAHDLVDAGADPAALDAHGRTALDIATENNAGAVREYLLKKFPALGPKPIDIPEVKVKFSDQQVYDFEENEEVSILSILSKMGYIVFKAKNSYFTIPLDTIRGAITDGSQIRYKCSKELAGAPYAKDVDMKHPYYYVQGNGNFIVPLASLGAAMKKYKILELVETDEVLENVASALSVQSSPGMNQYGEAVNIVSADHCQGGTRQKVFNLKGVLLTTKKEEEGAGRRLTKKRSTRRGGRTVKQKRGTYKRHSRR